MGVARWSVTNPRATCSNASGWGDQAPQRLARIRALGEAEGLQLNLHLARPINTFDAHRVIQLAAAKRRADRVVERLLRAYHTEALNIADASTLARLGADAGLEAEEVTAMVAGDSYAEEVRADERRAVEHGIAGVPSLVINGAPPVAGVQPIAELQRLLGRAAETAASGS